MPWDLGEVPGRKQRRVEDAYDMTSSVEAKYPEDVWAPPAGEPLPFATFKVYHADIHLKILVGVLRQIRIQSRISSKSENSFPPAGRP